MQAGASFERKKQEPGMLSIPGSSLEVQLRRHQKLIAP
jgi:hypothetical protein